MYLIQPLTCVTYVFEGWCSDMRLISSHCAIARKAICKAIRPGCCQLSWGGVGSCGM